MCVGILTHDPVEPQRLSLLLKMFWHWDKQDTDAAGWILPLKLSPLSNVIVHKHRLQRETVHTIFLIRPLLIAYVI